MYDVPYKKSMSFYISLFITTLIPNCLYTIILCGNKTKCRLHHLINTNTKFRFVTASMIGIKMFTVLEKSDLGQCFSLLAGHQTFQMRPVHLDWGGGESALTITIDLRCLTRNLYYSITIT